MYYFFSPARVAADGHDAHRTWKFYKLSEPAGGDWHSCRIK